MSINWSIPYPIIQYKECPTGPGIYAIGKAIDASKPVNPASEFDPYMFNWPDNLQPVYIGISESSGEGLRRRVRSHFKGRGNKKVANLIHSGENLFFMYCRGQDVVNFEALFLMVFTPGTGFTANKRSELRNFSVRLNKRIDSELIKKGIDPYNQPWMHDPDYFNDG